MLETPLGLVKLMQSGVAVNQHVLVRLIIIMFNVPIIFVLVLYINLFMTGNN